MNEEAMLRMLAERVAQPTPLHDSVERTAMPIEKTSSDRSSNLGSDKFAKLAYLAGAGADIGSTLYFNHHPKLNIHETNPLVNWAPVKAQMPIGMAMEGAAMLAGHKLLKNHPKVLNAVLATLGGVHGGFAAHNINLIRQKQNEMK